MVPPMYRVNYDSIAPLYDEPGRDHRVDPDLVQFYQQRGGQRLRILDMGCGTGKQLSANQGALSGMLLVGLDLFHGMLLQAHHRCSALNWIQGDNMYPPFARDSFDYITNQFSYHHIHDKERLVSETYRILKPGGRFVITNLDPWSMPGWIVYTYFPASRQRDLADFLPVKRLVAQMEGTGFCNIQVRREHNRSEEHLQEFHIYAGQRHRTSQLIAIPDSEYQAGIARLKQDIAKLGGSSCVTSEICLVWISGDKPRK